MIYAGKTIREKNFRGKIKKIEAFYVKLGYAGDRLFNSRHPYSKQKLKFLSILKLPEA